MAWEVRVSAAPDFHRTIFAEIQTSPMSTGRTNFSRTPRYISKKSPLYHISFTKCQPQSEKVLEGVWGNLFLKKVSPINPRILHGYKKEKSKQIHKKL